MPAHRLALGPRRDRLADQACRLVRALALAGLPLTAATQVIEPLISEAIASHPAVQSASRQQDAARAGLAGAQWQYWPTPSVSVEKASAGAADSADQGDSTVTLLRLQQPLWNGGRLAAGVARSEADIGVGQAALAEVRLQLAQRVVQAYGDWLAAQLKTVAQRKSQAAHEVLQARVRRRIAQGVSAESDGVLAVQRLQALAADLALSRSQEAIALARLGQLIGHAPDAALIGAAQASPRPLSPDLDELLAQARMVSPALQKAVAQTRVLAATLAERRAELSPEVYLRLERQYGNASLRSSGGQSRIFIGLSSRFGAGLSNLTSIDAARAQLEAAQADELTQARAVAEQVLSDQALAASAEARLAALQGSLQSAAGIGLAYDRQFLAGRKSWLDVMNAARELTQTEVALADTLSAQVVVSWRLALNVRGLENILNGMNGMNGMNR
jgi:adhesin transport system outer membrane protein